jgi:precorrin-8X/cobalt-precorrin-8 methylmutase
MIDLPKDIALVVAGHGSRDPDGVGQFERFVEVVRLRAGGRIVEHGYLEFARPTIDEGVRKAVQAGASKISVVPGVLLGATHAKNDMPVEVQALQREFPGCDIRYGAPMHLHPSVLQLCRLRIVEAEAKSARIVPRSDTCLVVVGRGTTDPDANSDVTKLARILEEGMGFAASFVCYSGTAKPGLSEGFETAVRLGCSRILVVPFFLFTGVLIKRIHAAVEVIAASRPHIEVLCAGHLDSHPLTADALLDRGREAFEGKALMNCGLCKYRTAIIGYENEAGAPQVGHHFHVRGGGTPAAEAGAAGAPPPAPQIQGSQAEVNAVPPAAGTAAPLAPAASLPYEMHPIEEKSFEIIASGRDWKGFPDEQIEILQRLVHTSGDFEAPDSMFLSMGAPGAGVRAILERSTIVTDVTMVQSGLRRALISQLGLRTACLVHDDETKLVAQANGLTKSAAGIRRAWLKYGNNVLLAIGDAPTAVEEAVRLVQEQGWRPRLVIGLPVGFVGTQESKERLRKCLHVPRITNRGTRGGSPWAAATVNALLIQASRAPLK